MFILLAPLAIAYGQQAEPTTLNDIIVEAHRVDPLLSVTASGGATHNAIVRSDPVGVRCGPTRFQYDAYEAPRLCWIRTPAGTPIRLKAENPGTLGWHVEWRGCEASADETECVLTMPAQGAEVSATFVAH
ncbi:hypothetical protein EGY25_00980 [Brevundimonas intermedia]|uniref:Uncharacterized protein n=1 Tax=Brevundimonas intermedia TaxID=74315 RepID=A0A4Y9S585_9CAUL|nr:hypothetical protein [Brevundimonas intermedia]TFW15196.1 hypothetical protein EGY25_00980 [Brevundimonas intermedia]